MDPPVISSVDPTSSILKEPVEAVDEPSLQMVNVPDDIDNPMSAETPTFLKKPARLIFPPSTVTVPPCNAKSCPLAFPILIVPAEALRAPSKVRVPPLAFTVALAWFTQRVVYKGIEAAVVANVTTAPVDNLKIPRVMVKNPDGAVKLLDLTSRVLPITPKFITILLNEVVAPVPETD
jgi:hypothetical protein